MYQGIKTFVHYWGRKILRKECEPDNIFTLVDHDIANLKLRQMNLDQLRAYAHQKAYTHQNSVKQEA